MRTNEVLHKPLQGERGTLENEPSYWAIIDYRKEPSLAELADGVMYYHNDGAVSEFLDTAQLKAFLDDYYPSWKEQVTFLDLEDVTFEELWEEIITKVDENNSFYEVPYTFARYVVQDAIFLTMEEAVDYVEKNKKMYSSHAYIERNRLPEGTLAYRIIKAMKETL